MQIKEIYPNDYMDLVNKEAGTDTKEVTTTFYKIGKAYFVHVQSGYASFVSQPRVLTDDERETELKKEAELLEAQNLSFSRQLRDAHEIIMPNIGSYTGTNN